jgi:hypothetical protein
VVFDFDGIDETRIYSYLGGVGDSSPEPGKCITQDTSTCKANPNAPAGSCCLVYSAIAKYTDSNLNVQTVSLVVEVTGGNFSSHDPSANGLAAGSGGTGAMGQINLQTGVVEGDGSISPYDPEFTLTLLDDSTGSAIQPSTNSPLDYVPWVLRILDLDNWEKGIRYTKETIELKTTQLFAFASAVVSEGGPLSGAQDTLDIKVDNGVLTVEALKATVDNPDNSLNMTDQQLASSFDVFPKVSEVSLKFKAESNKLKQKGRNILFLLTSGLMDDCNPMDCNIKEACAAGDSASVATTGETNPVCPALVDRPDECPADQPALGELMTAKEALFWDAHTSIARAQLESGARHGALTSFRGTAFEAQHLVEQQNCTNNVLFRFSNIVDPVYSNLGGYGLSDPNASECVTNDGCMTDVTEPTGCCMRFKGVGAVVNTNRPIDLVIEAVNLKDEHGDPVDAPAGVHAESVLEYAPKDPVYNGLMQTQSEGMAAAYPQINVQSTSSAGVSNGNDTTVLIDRVMYFRAFLVYKGTKTVIPPPPGLKLSLLNMDGAVAHAQTKEVFRVATANVVEFFNEAGVKMNNFKDGTATTANLDTSIDEPADYLTVTAVEESSTDEVSEGIVASFTFQDTSVMTFGVRAEGEDAAGFIGRNFVFDIRNVVPEGSGCTARSQSKRLKKAMHKTLNGRSKSSTRIIPSPLTANPMVWVAK